MPPLISVTASSKRKLLFCRVKSTLAQAATTFFHITTTPFPNLDPFRDYFVAYWSIRAGNAEVLFRFKAYVLLIAYMTGVWSILSAFSPLSTSKFSPLPSSLAIRLLLMDNLEMIQMPEKSRRHFYLLQTGLAAALPYLHWALYCRPGNTPLNDLIEDALFRNEEEDEDSQKKLNVKHIRKAGQRGFFSSAQVKSINQSIKNKTAFRRFAFRLANLVHLIFCVLVLNLCLLIYLFALGRYLLLLLQDSPHLFFHHLFCQAGNLLTSAVHILYTVLAFSVLSLLLLFHLLLYLTLWTSFVQTMILFIAFTILALHYFYRLFGQHYRRLTSCLHRACSLRRQKKPAKLNDGNGPICLPRSQRSLRQVDACLQANLHLFSAIFAGDAFLSQLFTVYLALHLPVTVYATVLIAYGQALEHHLVGLVIVGVVAEALLGSAFIHLSVARLSSCLHQGGRMLVAFTAENGAGGNAADETCCRFRPLPTRFALHLSVHISRLLVRRKYGITYGYLGTLVTMKTFFKCLLLWSELLMYAFTLMGNAK